MHHLILSSIIVGFVSAQEEILAAYCRENGAVPLNFATLVRNSALLAPPQDRFDKCRLDVNSPPEAIFPCLDQLGIKGYRFQGGLKAWDCPDPNAVEQCG